MSFFFLGLRTGKIHFKNSDLGSHLLKILPRISVTSTIVAAREIELKTFLKGQGEYRSSWAFKLPRFLESCTVLERPLRSKYDFEGSSSVARRRGTESFSGIESFYGMLGRGSQQK